MGELLNGIFNEAVGNDPQNRRIAKAPLNAAWSYAVLQGTGQTLGALSSVPTPGPAFGFGGPSL